MVAKLIEHVSDRTFESEAECLNTVNWICKNLYKEGQEFRYSVIPVEGGFKYRTTFKQTSAEDNPALFDNQKVVSE